MIRYGVMKMLLFLAIVTGCSKDNDYGGLLQSPTSPNERFAQSLKQERRRYPGKITLETNSYHLLVAGDCHVGGTVNLDKLLVHARDTGILALVLAGDITTGKTEDYTRLVQAFENAGPASRYLVAGNHDLFFDGWKNFYSCFGPSAYTVIIETPGGSDLIIFLDTGSGTLGEAQLKWLKDLLANERAKHRNCMVVTHTNFFRKELTESTNLLPEELYILLDLFCRFRVNMVITGHDHQRNEQVLGITRYITLDGLMDGLSNASYMQLDVCDGIIRYRFIKP